MKKTATFVAVAVLIGFFAWSMTPGTVETVKVASKDQALFPNFKSALDATSLSIDEFDEGTATIRPFKVAKVKGNWVIPSHQDYPTDAKDQLGAAAANLVGLRILGTESDSPADHAKFGVIAPIESEVKEHGTKGVGSRVTLGDANDNTLFDVIIGNEVKGAPGQRYIRIGTSTQLGKEPRYSDEVYAVAMKTDKITSTFENWIERDLLKISAWDLRQLELKDYTVDTALALTGQLSVKVHDRSDITLAFDDQKGGWTLVSLKEFDDKRQPKEVKLADDEELNLAKLQELKTALADLKIVDVEQKPAGLGSDVDALIHDHEGFMSLVTNGFFPMKGKDGKPEILSNEGDIRLRMKDGVEYVLRFGAVASLDSGSAKKDEEKKDDAKAAEGTAPAGGRNRYVMVVAEFNPDQVPNPVLEPLPEEKKDDKKSAETKPADAKKPDDGKTDGKAEDAPKDPEQEAIAAQRQEIEKSNQRKQDEYDAKVKAGQDHAKQLNERFGQWYYIVSDDVYRKLHLSRDEVIKKKKDPAKDPNTAKALEQGLPLEPEGQPQ